MLKFDYTYRFLNKVSLVDAGLFIAAILTISIVVKLIRVFSSWASKKFPSKRMVFFGWVPFINFTIYFIGLLLSFYMIFEPSREFLITFVISSVLSVGFAVKDVVTSIIAGITLLIDKPFQVGDRITFEEHYGEILLIGLRSVQLLTLDQSIVTIPNNRFLNDAVSSSSAGDLGMMVTVDVYVRPQLDLYKVKEILKKEAEKNEYVVAKEKIVIVCKEVLGLNGEVIVMMTTKCIIKDARLEKEFQTDFILSIHKQFKMNGIES